MESTVEAARPPDEPTSNQQAPAPRNIFISYSRKDQDFAEWLTNGLRDDKLPVWIDEAEIQGGAEWAQTIEAAICDCTEFVLILSPNSRTSDYVENELIFAKGLKKAIRPVLLQSCEPWIHIARIQSIDFRKNREKGLKLLKQPPRKTLWRRVVSFTIENPAFRPYLAAITLALGIAASLYYLPPSNTSFNVTRGGWSDIVVHVRNQGGRPSMLMGSSFKLRFGSLPIETEPLVLRDPKTPSRIAGHSDEDIHLTGGTLTPKKKTDDSYFSKADIKRLLPSAKLILIGQVKESDNRIHTRSSEVFPGDRVENFVLGVFPDVVP